MERTRRFKGNKGKYLAELATNPNKTIRDICREVEISESTYYGWMKEDDAFAGQVQKVREAAADVFEQIIGSYSERLAYRLVELAENVEDKRTALDAVKEITKLIRKSESKGQPTVKSLSFEFE